MQKEITDFGFDLLFIIFQILISSNQNDNRADNFFSITYQVISLMSTQIKAYLVLENLFFFSYPLWNSNAAVRHYQCFTSKFSTICNGKLCA